MSNGYSPNPYNAPSPTSWGSTQHVPEVFDDAIRQDLKSIARWQMFFGVLGIIGSVLMLLIFAIQFLIIGGRAGGAGIAGFLVAMVVFVAITILIYLIPAIRLLQASKAAREFQYGDNSQLKTFVAAQRSFWRYIGFVVIAVMALYAVILVVGLLFAIVVSAGR